MDADAETVGFLVVGVGFLGSRRASAVAAARGCRLVALTDVDGGAASALAARLGAVATPDLAAGLGRAGVDAVIIATPHADHAGQARLALEAGKRVLCEKPLTVDPDDARALATMADAARLRLATGFNHRFYPPVRDALALVQGGAIGRVESVRAQIGHRASAEFLRGWHVDVGRSGGGTLMDNGPHACDLIRRLLGEVVVAHGTVRDDIGLPEGCESEAFALFRTDDGGVAELRSSWALEEGYLTIDVRGSKGHLRVETAPWGLSGTLAGGRRLRRRYLRERVAEALFRRKFGCERSLVRELEAFVRPGGYPRPGASGWDGCRATEMVRAVYESAATGREARLDPLPVRLPGVRTRSPRGEAA